MQKPASLRKALTAAVPELARQPEKLTMYVKSGKVQGRWSAQSMSYAHAYTLDITILEFSGAPDSVFLPIMNWLKDHQPSALQNHDNGDSAIRFDADILDNQTVDLSIMLQLDEAVDVVRNATGGFDLKPRPEPRVIGTELFPGVDPCVVLTEIYDQSGNLLIDLSQADNDG